MKELIFNDARSLEVQSVSVAGEGVMHIRAILVTSEILKAHFMDKFATSRMTLYENHTEKETYENYDKLSYLKEEAGGIWEVEMIQSEKSVEERLSKVEESQKEQNEGLKEAKKEIEELKETGGAPEAYASVFAMAKMSAEEITDDEQALKVADLYDVWSGDGVTYKTGKYLLYKDILYKALQNHTSQPDWTPDTASSLYTKVLTDPSGSVLPWEQPQSTNGYKKGDRVMHNGKTWESLVDSNVWEPGAVGSESLWKEVKEE